MDLKRLIPKSLASVSTIMMFALVNSNFAWADAPLCETVKPIHFAPHAAGAVVHGAIAPGEVDCWTFGAHAGQKARLSISSEEGTGVFEFYQPGWKLIREDGTLTVNGHAYPGAGDGDDANTWRGVIAATGGDLITVGATRAGTGYTLKLSIEP